MSSFANTIKAILIKDLVSELRAKQTLPAMIMLGVLIAWIFRITTEGAAVEISVTGAAVLLVSLVFSAILASEKIFAIEQQNDCMGSLLLAPIDAGDIYIGKLLVNITMLCIFEIVAVPVVLVLFKISAGVNWLGFVGILMLVNIGVSAIGTLLGCAVQGTKAAGSLLSILVMAALCPMMIPAVFALILLFGATEAGTSGTLGMVGNLRAAAGFLAACDAIFVTVSWLLFGFVAGEWEK